MILVLTELVISLLTYSQNIGFRLFLANVSLIIYLKKSSLALQYSQNHFPFGLSIKPTQPR